MTLRRCEKDVLASVRKLLTSLGIFHVRMNVGMFRNPRGQPVKFGAKGIADLLALPYSTEHVVLWIETKASNGRQTAAQKFFEQTVLGYGHEYLLARSAAEVIEWLVSHRARARGEGGSNL